MSPCVYDGGGTLHSEGAMKWHELVRTLCAVISATAAVIALHYIIMYHPK